MKTIFHKLFVCTLLVAACTEPDNEETPETPDVQILCITGEATFISANSAILNGNATIQNASASSAQAWFYYSSEASDAQTLQSTGSKVSAGQLANTGGDFSCNLNDLYPSSTYYYVASVSIDGQEVTGGVKSFLTEKAPDDATVDLGLSVKWASCNLGASKPEEYGGYYQWAGTVDVTNRSYILDWDKCPYHTEYSYDIGWSKYYSNLSNNLTTLEASDDAATVHLGEAWRMPTDEEWTELLENCTWKWTTLNGVNGQMGTSKENGNTIFLPAGGYRRLDALHDEGSYGDYWSSSLYLDGQHNGCCAYLYSDGVFRYRYYRYYGYSIRPVLK